MLDNYSILIGPLRLMLIFIFLYFLNKYVIKYSIQKDSINFLVTRWVKYASLSIIIVFLLVQINAYDIFSLLLIFICSLVYKFTGYDGNSKFIEHLQREKLSLLLFGLKKIEKKSSILIKYKNKSQLHKKLTLVLIILVATLAFIVRVYFYNYDLYTFSPFWFQDLTILNNLNHQQWISTGNVMIGEYALISLFAKLTGINPEMAIQSFSIIESSLICVVIYWFTYVLSKSRYIAPLISSLSFALLYFLIPVNINFITQHSQMLLALMLLLPCMVFILIPERFVFDKKKYFKYHVVFISAIFLTNLFTALILFPLFLIVAFLFHRRRNYKYLKKAIKAYLLAFTIVGVYYAIGGYILGYSFVQFLYTNLVSISTVKFTPQLIIPYENLIVIHLILSVISSIIILFKVKYKKSFNRPLFIFLSFFIVLVFVEYLTKNLDIWFIDKDLVMQSMTIFMSILLGVNSAVFFNLLKVIHKIESRKIPAAIASSLILTLFISVFCFGHQKINLNKEKSNIDSQKMLLAYYKISQTFLPFSYAVINKNKFQSISRDKHFFINYKDFVDTYEEKDSIYFEHINDKEYLKENPQIILPASILVFIKEAQKEKKKTKKKEGHFHHHSEEDLHSTSNLEVISLLNKLKSKGRKVAPFFTDGKTKIFEIVNSPKSSKIKDLIF